MDLSKNAPKAGISRQFSRRNFLTKTSYLGALCAAAEFLPMHTLSASLPQNSRVSQTPIADKGFASVRKVGDGLYATISDPSKGIQTVSNGGFLVGKDSVMLIEGFISAAGAAFQFETMRGLSQAPVKCALDTHYHYDHSLGNAFYGANGIQLWAHPATAKRIASVYAAQQGADKEKVLAPYEDRKSTRLNSSH